MDMSSGEWLSDLANEDPETIIDHCQMMMRSLVDDDEFNDIFQPSNIFSNANNNNNLKLIKSEELNSTWEPKIAASSDSTSSWSSPGQLISFASSEYEANRPKQHKNEVNQWRKRVAGSTTCTEEHVAAERKRREKMTQGFVALSSLIPGLKKMDKASILAETAEYLKQLEQRAKLLEEHATKRTVESVLLVKYSNSNQDYFNKTMRPDDILEVDAKFCNNNILIRIHSLKKQGLIQTILEELRKLNIAILNCQTMPFGSYALDVTIIAQVNDDFCMTSEDLMNFLEKALKT